MAQKNEFKNSYVFATETGFKIVNKDTLKVERHAGTEEEVNAHEKMGVGKGAILESKVKKAPDAQSEVKTTDTADEMTYISRKEFEKLPNDEKAKYEKVSGKGYTLIKEGE